MPENLNHNPENIVTLLFDINGVELDENSGEIPYIRAALTKSGILRIAQGQNHYDFSVNNYGVFFSANDTAKLDQDSLNTISNKIYTKYQQKIINQYMHTENRLYFDSYEQFEQMNRAGYAVVLNPGHVRPLLLAGILNHHDLKLIHIKMEDLNRSQEEEYSYQQFFAFLSKDRLDELRSDNSGLVDKMLEAQILNDQTIESLRNQ